MIDRELTFLPRFRPTRVSRALFVTFLASFRSRAALQLEIVALRRRLDVLLRDGDAMSLSRTQARVVDCGPEADRNKHGGLHAGPATLIPQPVKFARGTGMMITSNHDVHMSAHNTVSCMGQGRGAGTAALCAATRCSAHGLPYSVLREAPVKGGVYLEG